MVKWISVARADLDRVSPSDIVRVEPRRDGRPHLTVVLSASDELSSPER